MQSIYFCFYPGQGLGNQLLSYIGVYSIAKYIKANFQVLGYSHYKGKAFLPLVEGINSLSSENPSAIIRDLPQVEERQFYDHSLKAFLPIFDPSLLCLDETCLVNGLFHDLQYLTLAKTDVISLLRPVISLNEYTSQENTLFINIRGGEYRRHPRLILPASYWHRSLRYALQAYPVNSVTVVTDDPEYASAIFPGVSIFTGSLVSCFASILNAKYCIISNSSFPVVPLMLNRFNPSVIAPVGWARYGHRSGKWASPSHFNPAWTWMSPNGVACNSQLIYEIKKQKLAHLGSGVIIARRGDMGSSLVQHVPPLLRDLAKSLYDRLFLAFTALAGLLAR